MQFAYYFSKGPQFYIHNVPTEHQYIDVPVDKIDGVLIQTPTIGNEYFLGTTKKVIDKYSLIPCAEEAIGEQNNLLSDSYNNLLDRFGSACDENESRIMKNLASEINAVNLHDIETYISDNEDYFSRFLDTDDFNYCISLIKSGTDDDEIMENLSTGPDSLIAIKQAFIQYQNLADAVQILDGERIPLKVPTLIEFKNKYMC